MENDYIGRLGKASPLFKLPPAEEKERWAPGASSSGDAGHNPSGD
jgi:hypothetical protein